MKTTLEIVSGEDAPGFVKVKMTTTLRGDSELKQETVLHRTKLRSFFNLFMKTLSTGKTLVFQSGGDIGGNPKSKAEAESRKN